MDEVKVELAFNKQGRIIPPDGLKGAVCPPDERSGLFQPEIDYHERMSMLCGGVVAPNSLRPEEFEKQSKLLLEQLRRDSVLSGLLNGVFLPVCIYTPPLGDYGSFLERYPLEMARRSYKGFFPGREFYNCQEGRLRDKISVVEKSHDRLLKKAFARSVVGIQFFPLQGFSVEAAREIAALFPDSLLLSGSIDMAIAIATYPDVLANEFSPRCDCAAVSWGHHKDSSGFSLFFEADNRALRFGVNGYLGEAEGHASPGVIFIGHQE